MSTPELAEGALDANEFFFVMVEKASREIPGKKLTETELAQLKELQKTKKYRKQVKDLLAVNAEK